MNSNNNPKVALITGVTGQDGAYLARFLLEKGYTVHGVKRRSSMLNTARVDGIYQDPHIPNGRFFLHFGDLTDSTNILRIIQEVKPDEIYNLAAQSHVKVSFETPEYTANADAVGPLRILEAIRILGWEKRVRFYQASTSEMFSGLEGKPYDENSRFEPRSPYGVAKLYAHWITLNYREAYNIFAVSGILFNHESPLRGESFVTRKITRAVADIACGGTEPIYLGNLDAKRDWGHSEDYVRGMWMMMQQSEPRDFILATGRAENVRWFAEEAFSHIDRRLKWQGDGEAEEGVDADSGQTLIKVDPRYYRPLHVDTLIGNASAAREILGWEPQVTLEELVATMVEEDLRQRRESGR